MKIICGISKNKTEESSKASNIKEVLVISNISFAGIKIVSDGLYCIFDCLDDSKSYIRFIIPFLLDGKDICNYNWINRMKKLKTTGIGNLPVVPSVMSYSYFRKIIDDNNNELYSVSCMSNTVISRINKNNNLKEYDLLFKYSDFVAIMDVCHRLLDHNTLSYDIIDHYCLIDKIDRLKVNNKYRVEILGNFCPAKKLFINKYRGLSLLKLYKDESSYNLLFYLDILKKDMNSIDLKNVKTNLNDLLSIKFDDQYVVVDKIELEFCISAENPITKKLYIFEHQKTGDKLFVEMFEDFESKLYNTIRYHIFNKEID